MNKKPLSSLLGKMVRFKGIGYVPGKGHFIRVSIYRVQGTHCYPIAMRTRKSNEDLDDEERMIGEEVPAAALLFGFQRELEGAWTEVMACLRESYPNVDWRFETE